LLLRRRSWLPSCCTAQSIFLLVLLFSSVLLCFCLAHAHTHTHSLSLLHCFTHPQSVCPIFLVFFTFRNLFNYFFDRTELLRTSSHSASLSRQTDSLCLCLSFCESKPRRDLETCRD
jgi:hypothetical protein